MDTVLNSSLTCVTFQGGYICSCEDGYDLVDNTDKLLGRTHTLSFCRATGGEVKHELFKKHFNKYKYRVWQVCSRETRVFSNIYIIHYTIYKLVFNK